MGRAEWKVSRKKRYIRAYNGAYSIGEVIKHTGNYRGKTDYYQLSIRGEDFEIQELRWEIDFYIGIHKADEAEKLLHILKKKIDLTNPYNEQYVKEIELFIRDERNEVSCEEYVQEIFELLSITIKDVDRLKEDGIENCFFTREELVLLMNLGCTYHQHKQYKEALKYYHKIEGYLRDFYQLSSAGIYKTTLLFNIGWCYGKMFLEEDCKKKEKYKRYANQYFQQSFCMAKLYGDEQVKEIIRENKELWNI